MNTKEIKKYALVGFIICVVFLVLGCGTGASKSCVNCYAETTLDGQYKALYGYHVIWDFLAYPIAGLMLLIGKSVALSNYGVTIVISTIIVRTIAWPIYAKSNDMSLKMQLIAPETQKIEARYAGKTDQESTRRKQMEMANIYKKYGIGFGGCLMPLIQMPIFMAFFEVLRRMPSTSMNYINAFKARTFDDWKAFGIAEDKITESAMKAYEGVEKLPINFDFFQENNHNMFLGLDLFKTMGSASEAGNKFQFYGIIVLAILVGGTQVLSQILTTQRQKKQKKEQESNIPDYRKPAKTDQQNQTELMMKIMLYGMPIMMVVFILRSPAALGLYWFVGNLYSMLQSLVGFKQSNKRLEKMKNKMSKQRV